MSVDVIVPASTSDDAHRLASRQWVVRRYRTLHADWPVAVALHTGPWCKAEAVNPIAADSDADVLVLADADSFVAPDALRASVADVTSGRHDWAVPAFQVRRMTEAASRAVLELDPDTLPDPRSPVVRSHSLLPGGGIVVVSRALWLDADGYDPRFIGWGGEDYALGCALRALSGHYAHKQPGVLWHLWHPPAPSNGGLLPDESAALATHYRAAKHDPAAMRSLIQQREAALWL